MCDVRTSAVVRLLIQVNSPGSVCWPHRAISSSTQSTSVLFAASDFPVSEITWIPVCTFIHVSSASSFLSFCHQPLVWGAFTPWKAAQPHTQKSQTKTGKPSACFRWAKIKKVGEARCWWRNRRKGGSSGATSYHVLCKMWSHGVKFYMQAPFPMGLPKWQSGKRLCLPMQEMLEMWVLSLGQEDSLEEEMATYSSILTWRIPWTEEPGRLQSMGSQSWLWLSDYARTHALSQVSFRNSLLIFQLTYRGICCICVCSSETRNVSGAPLRGLVEKNHSGETHGAIRMCVATKWSLRRSIKSTNALRTGRGVCAAASV